jgi:hypothetical protein
MATKNVTTTVFVCDMTGKEMSAEDVNARSFDFNGKTYTFHFSDEAADEFDQTANDYEVAGLALAGFLQRGKATKIRKPTTGPTGAPTGASAVVSEKAAIRAWAIDNGHAVGAKGRIPSAVVDAYTAAVGA